MEFKGTKEKWVKYNLTPSHATSTLRGAGVCGVTHEICQAYGRTSEEALANAQLISKAPEMLDMLQYLIDDEQLSSDSIANEIKELIKEATTV